MCLGNSWIESLCPAFPEIPRGEDVDLGGGGMNGQYILNSIDDWVLANSTTEAVESIHLTLVRYTDIVTEICASMHVPATSPAS
jgi:hypothetical protein